MWVALAASGWPPPRQQRGVKAPPARAVGPEEGAVDVEEDQLHTAERYVVRYPLSVTRYPLSVTSMSGRDFTDNGKRTTDNAFLVSQPRHLFRALSHPHRPLDGHGRRPLGQQLHHDRRRRRPIARRGRAHHGALDPGAPR